MIFQNPGAFGTIGVPYPVNVMAMVKSRELIFCGKMKFKGK